MTVIEAVNAPTPKAAAVQPIASDLEATGGAAANDKQAETPIFKEYGLPNDGPDNHNRIKGGAGHVSGLPAKRQGPQSLSLSSRLTWQELKPAQKSPRANELLAQCEDLARQPNILDRFEEAVGRFVVGEGHTTRLLYLAVTSRFLKRPVSIAMKGPASSGKSFLTEQVLRFFPPSAYSILTATSEKALAYWDEPLKHRFLVILEAKGLQGEWASYFVRSLLSEGRIRYLTVEKIMDRPGPLLIEREGPTGLISTTTEISLHPENETRWFSVDVDDSAGQTRKVLKAIAESTNEENTVISDNEISIYVALQGWLAGANHCVVIPYASLLAEKIPPVAVRLRRDFEGLLNLIKAHAILHQANRQLDDRGRIIATLADYRAVRDLVAPIISQASQMTASDTMRETVEAVRELNKRAARSGGGASERQVAEILKLDRSATSRRVNSCLERGYLSNLQSKRGSAYKLVLGDPLPGEVEVLPDPESLEGCCSVAVLQCCSRFGGHRLPSPCSELSGSAILETEEVL